MNIYCSHFDKVLTKGSNYFHCPSCRRGWYGTEPAPLVVIGFTDAYEASPNYADQFEKKDLSKKTFKRCKYCKDLLEKRRHTLCNFKAQFEVYRKRHNEFVAQVMVVIRGFKRDK